MTTAIKSNATSGEIQVNGVTKLTVAESGIVTATVTPTSATPKALATMDAVAAADTVVTGQMLGVGQSWRNLVSNRALGNTYTNSSGKPITVSVSATTGVNASLTLSVLVDNVSIMVTTTSLSVAGSFTSTGTFLVPDDTTYAVNVYAGTPVLQRWSELR
jgi:hypothetical protein